MATRPPNKPANPGAEADMQALMMARVDNVLTAIENTADYLEVIAQTLLTMATLQAYGIACRNVAAGQAIQEMKVTSEGVLCEPNGTPVGPVLFDESTGPAPDASPETKSNPNGSGG